MNTKTTAINDTIYKDWEEVTNGDDGVTVGTVYLNDEGQKHRVIEVIRERNCHTTSNGKMIDGLSEDINRNWVRFEVIAVEI